MRILVLQFAPATRARRVPRFEPQLGTLLALLERREHQLALEGLAQFDLERVKAALARSLPQLVYADISAVCTDAARRTLEYLQRREFLPVVVGGEYPTIDPAASLSLPGVQAAAVGEPDASLVTYFERMKDPAAAQVVLGVWLRDERGTVQPALPPLVEDLNSLPFAHRDLFGYAEHVRAAGQIEIAIGRGCPQRCTYCVNDRRRELAKGRGAWVRRRAPGNILAEINLLRERYPGIRSVRFLDHTFALDRGWLETFLEAYPRQCGLPFQCHVRANAADEPTIQRLATAGCQLADVEVISASNLMRNEILEMDLTKDQIRNAFARLKAAGIRQRAIVYLGAPYESEASLDETRKLLVALQPDIADIRPYYPWPGTRARTLCQEQGWIHPRGEEQYHHDLPGVDIPACRPAVLTAFMRRLRSELAAGRDGPWWKRWPAAWSDTLRQGLRRRRTEA
jgi:radical SAM superfamily enzyme YgiQ (UPF0313 family)